MNSLGRWANCWLSNMQVVREDDDSTDGDDMDQDITELMHAAGPVKIDTNGGFDPGLKFAYLNAKMADVPTTRGHNLGHNHKCISRDSLRLRSQLRRPLSTRSPSF